MFVDEIEALVGSSDAAVDAALREVELESRRLEARRAAVLAVADAHRVYRHDGHTSLRNHVSATCNSSRALSLRERRRSALCAAHPAVGDALWIGRIGVSQADELATVHANPRVTDTLGEALPLLLDRAEHLPFDDFRTCLKRWVMLIDLDGSFREGERSVDRRRAHVSMVGDELDVQASGGDALTGEKMVAVFRQFVEAEFDKDCTARRAEHGDDAAAHPLPRTGAQRRFDALVAVFDAASTAPADGKRPDPVVNIVVDGDTLDEAFTRAGILLPDGRQIDLADPHDGMHRVIEELAADPARFVDRRCETAGGIPVHPTLVLQAALTGHVRRVVMDSLGRVIDLGRRERLFRGGARVAAQIAAIHCAHAGCDIPAALCDVDHIDEWAGDDGSTDPANGNVKCGSHDRFKHRERWRTRRSSSGRAYDIRPGGTIVLPVGEREPDLTVDETERLVRSRMDALLHELERERAVRSSG